MRPCNLPANMLPSGGRQPDAAQPRSTPTRRPPAAASAVQADAECKPSDFSAPVPPFISPCSLSILHVVVPDPRNSAPSLRPAACTPSIFWLSSMSASPSSSGLYSQLCVPRVGGDTDVETESPTTPSHQTNSPSNANRTNPAPTRAGPRSIASKSSKRRISSAHHAADPPRPGGVTCP